MSVTSRTKKRLAALAILVSVGVLLATGLYMAQLRRDAGTIDPSKLSGRKFPVQGRIVASDVDHLEPWSATLEVQLENGETATVVVNEFSSLEFLVDPPRISSNASGDDPFPYRVVGLRLSGSAVKPLVPGTALFIDTASIGHE